MQAKDPSVLRNSRFLAKTLFSAAILLAPLSTVGAQRLSIRGSDTLIFLGQRFGAMYSRTFPGLQIRVDGGGSTPALTAVAAKQADIAQFEGEPPTSGSPDLISFRAGVQAIAVYVNASNPVHELTIAQLRAIFLGQITNWKILGGPDATILLYAGESTTGILNYFQESVLHGEEPYPFVGKSNTMGLLDEIASHPEAIGYGSLGAAPGTRAVGIKLVPTSLAVEPTEATIRSRQYPVTRYVSWVVPRHRDPDLNALCHWVLSSEGQLVVEAAGFEPLLPAERVRALAQLDKR